MKVETYIIVGIASSLIMYAEIFIPAFALSGTHTVSDIPLTSGFSIKAGSLILRSKRTMSKSTILVSTDQQI